MEMATDRCTRGTSQIETFCFVVIYGVLVVAWHEPMVYTISLENEHVIEK